MKALPWEPVPNILGPCADIFFDRLGSEDLLRVTMRFSDVEGLPNQDLRLEFTQPLLLKWELECPGFDPVPEVLPKCPTPEWSDWTFPLLQVEGADWLDTLRLIYRQPNKAEFSHFLLVSMNDLVQIVARSDVRAVWVPGSAERKTDS